MTRPTSGARHRAKLWAANTLTKAGTAFNAGVVGPRRTVIDVLRETALAESAEMIHPHLGTASLFSTVTSLRSWLGRRLVQAPNGLFLEFGYYLGESARHITAALSERPDQPTLFAFDAFEGLRDAWSGPDYPKGAFDLGGQRPEPSAGLSFVVGWLEDTLPRFLLDHPEPVSFCHFDLDVYPPTVFGLRMIRERLRPGSLLLFDELHGFPGWQEHEWRALCDVFDPTDYKFLAFGPEQGLLEIM